MNHSAQLLIQKFLQDNRVILSAFAWRGYQHYGRGIVTIKLQSELRELSYIQLEALGPGLVRQMVLTYDVHTQVVAWCVGAPVAICTPTTSPQRCYELVVARSGEFVGGVSDGFEW